jgi:hypothetical protein
MTIYSTQRVTGYSGPPPNASLYANKPIIINPQIINTTVMMLPVDFALGRDQVDERKRAMPLEGNVPAHLRGIFNE